jgi:hypothetical protein
VVAAQRAGPPLVQSPTMGITHEGPSESCGHARVYQLPPLRAQAARVLGLATKTAPPATDQAALIRFPSCTEKRALMPSLKPNIAEQLIGCLNFVCREDKRPDSGPGACALIGSTRCRASESENAEPLQVAATA